MVRGDGGPGAGAVLDHDGLAERGADGNGEDPRDEVGEAAGREAHDPADRPTRRPSGALGAGLRRREREGGGGEEVSALDHGAVSPKGPLGGAFGGG